jgi:dethiobiotin synthetase
MKGRKYFVTGTDTNIGKTYVTLSLMSFLKKKGNSVVGMKPVSAGVECFNGLEINSDVLHIMQSNSLEIDQSMVNQYALKDAASPHISASRQGISIDFELIKSQVKVLEGKADFLLIEGAGGYECPLDSLKNVSDLIKYLDIPVIFVIGIKLGCLNHSLLTIKSMESKNQKIFGWVANIIEPEMKFIDENILFLKNFIHAPCLGVMPFSNVMDKDRLEDYILWPAE